MGILADFEDSIGKVVEGTFGGIFRSHVQPAEIARACAKEMDRSKKLGIGKVYVANFYTIILSPRDGDALGGLMSVLESELETYLLGHARENNYQLATRPVTHFVTDPELKLGRFDVIGETMSQAEIDKELGIEEEAAASVRPSPPPVAEPEIATALPHPDLKPLLDGDSYTPTEATLTSPLIGTITIGEQDLYTIGRKENCDIRLEDSAASRLHATLTFNDTNWVITDNESTNTTQINGQPITSKSLVDGDIITIGTTQFTYRLGEASDSTAEGTSAYPTIKGFL
ncbi:MAG: DUF3662 and FHA domain-containing protein [Coriobacteriia bacterium]|nr:DUF3662 and FHA domain-containing protein [Coriobacteriia bacterium]